MFLLEYLTSVWSILKTDKTKMVFLEIMGGKTKLWHSNRKFLHEWTLPLIRLITLLMVSHKRPQKNFSVYQHMNLFPIIFRKNLIHFFGTQFRYLFDNFLVHTRIFSFSSQLQAPLFFPLQFMGTILKCNPITERISLVAPK